MSEEPITAVVDRLKLDLSHGHTVDAADVRRLVTAWEDSQRVWRGVDALLDDLFDEDEVQH